MNHSKDGKVLINSEKLKELRLNRGFSQERLAQYSTENKLSISSSTIKRAESGKFILYRTVSNLASIFDVEIKYLLN